MHLIKRFVAYYKPYLGLFAKDMLCALGVALCNLIYPKLTGAIIDTYIPDRNVRAILIFAAALLLLYIGKKMDELFYTGLWTQDGDRYPGGYAPGSVFSYGKAAVFFF